MKKTGTLEICAGCNKNYYLPLWRKARGAKYCSYKCYWENKNDTPWNKGTKGLIKKNDGSFSNTKHKWSGDIKEYKNLHYWIGKTLGKPRVCSICGDIKEGKAMHWANKSGNYKTDPSDWIRLCAKCHYIFDNVEMRRKLWQS